MFALFLTNCVVTLFIKISKTGFWQKLCLNLDIVAEIYFKQVANMEDSSYGIFATLTVTCLFNGNYDFNVLEWTCTDCLQRPNPPHSYFWCESNRLEVGSTCALTCDPGFIPLGITLMECIYDKVSSHRVKSICPS